LRKILIASDHAGFKLKEIIKQYLSKKKIKVVDLGPSKLTKVDYPDYAHKLSKKINLNKKLTGILVCGSGIGMEMTANRYKNVELSSVIIKNQLNYQDCIIMLILLHLDQD